MGSFLLFSGTEVEQDSVVLFRCIFILFLKFAHPAENENFIRIFISGGIKGKIYFFSFIISIISIKELISLSDSPSTFRVLIFSFPMR